MQEVTKEIVTPLYAAWLRIAEQVGALLPKIAGFILIIIIGWFISKLFSSVIKKFLRLVRLNVLSEKAGIEAFLKRGGIKRTFVDILGGVIYWFFLLITFITAFDSVGLTVVSSLLNRILLYIPNVFVAAIIVVIGFYLAKLVSTSVRVFAGNLGVGRPNVVAQGTNYVLLFFVFTIVLEQLGISREIVTNAFTIVLGTLGLGIAIAIGLGSKDFVVEMWKKYEQKRKK